MSLRSFISVAVVGGVVEVNYKYLCGNKSSSAMLMLESKINEVGVGIVDWYRLSENPFAMSLLLRYRENISWTYLSSNPNPSAIALLESNRDRIEYRNLAKNPNAIHLLREYLEGPNGSGMDNILVFKLNLSKNPNAYELLVRYPHLRCDMGLNLNPNPACLSLCSAYHDGWLFSNAAPSATVLIHRRLQSYLENEWITYIARNENPDTFSMLETMMDMHPEESFADGLMETCLSRNPAAIGLLERRPDLIHWEMIWSNSGIFETSAV